MTKHNSQILNRTQPALAPGRWRVDATQSTATFSARGFWGAVPVTGGFDSASGTATVDAEGRLQGELVIPASTLNSGLKLRDRHLRSAAFFDVGRHPEIRFDAQALTAAQDGHVVHGRLSVRDRSIELALPAQLVSLPQRRVELKVETVLDRSALGLEHSPLGMIRGAATVRVHVVLEQDQ